MMFRFVTTGVYWNGFAGGVSVVSFIDGELNVVPFEKELHSTVFVPGPVAILDASRFDEFVADDIEMMVGGDGNLHDKKRLDDYLKSSGLYFDGKGSPLFLKLGSQCQIIPIN